MHTTGRRELGERVCVMSLSPDHVTFFKKLPVDFLQSSLLEIHWGTVQMSTDNLSGSFYLFASGYFIMNLMNDF